MHDSAVAWTHAVATGNKTRIIGPNCPGIISPGKSNAGIIPMDAATSADQPFILGVTNRAVPTYKAGFLGIDATTEPGRRPRCQRLLALCHVRGRVRRGGLLACW